MTQPAVKPGAVAQSAPTVKLPDGFKAFTDLRPKRRLISVDIGHPGSGKTDWALRTSPEPIFYINLDPNGEEIAKKIILETGRRIYIARVEFTRDMSESAAKAEWAKCEKIIDNALKFNEGTMVLDTATEADELWRVAHFGKLEQVSQYKYGERNKFWKGFFNDCFTGDMSVILLHKLKALYVNDKRTDKFEISGWNGMEFEAQCVLYHEWVDPKGDEPGRFTFRVTKNNANAELRGLEGDTENWSFDSLLSSTYDV